MTIYWKKLGEHIHMRVFTHGAKMGDLCCRADEWKEVQACFTVNTVFRKDAEEPFHSTATKERGK